MNCFAGDMELLLIGNGHKSHYAYIKDFKFYKSLRSLRRIKWEAIYQHA